MNQRSIASDLAKWLIDRWNEVVPDEVLHAAARQTLDTYACALGALDHAACEAALQVAIALGGPPESSLIGQTHRIAAANAVLYNGTLFRALDCNDILFNTGPSGHPSDNIAVALALAESEHATGRDFLSAIAIGYELYFRFSATFKADQATAARHWDLVSTSGIVAAAVTGLLSKFDETQLTHAIEIAGAQSLTLREVRTGEISMLKAAADARVGQAGVIGALLAKFGMSGPSELFEGDHGVLIAMGDEDVDAFRSGLIGPVERWAIRDITSKPFPAIGTSQGAISATLEIVHGHGIGPKDVQSVEITLADIPTSRRQIANPSSATPTTRETADHSLPFLVAVSIEDGDFGIDQYRDERWLNTDTRKLMSRVTQVTDASLNPHATHGYPAVVMIITTDGKQLRSEYREVPGTPERPFSDAELMSKLRRLAGSKIAPENLHRIGERILGIADEHDMATAMRDLTKLVIAD